MKEADYRNDSAVSHKTITVIKQKYSIRCCGLKDGHEKSSPCLPWVHSLVRWREVLGVRGVEDSLLNIKL